MLQLSKRDWFFVVSVALILLLIAVLGWITFGEITILLVVVLGVIIQVVVITVLYRRNARHTETQLRTLLRDHSEQQFRRIEAHLSVLSFLKPEFPLPSGDRWTASPDLLKYIIEVIITNKPRLVVEAGSGLSSLIIAYCLSKLGNGRLISLENNSEIAEKNKKIISLHGLDDRADIAYTPLSKFELNGSAWQWYDLTKLQFNEKIDLLIIDGPPRSIQKHARYPALPLLYDYLGENFCAIVDDANRPAEKEVVRRWENEYPNLEFAPIALERGAYLITRIAHDR